jgi:hypothetical protein
MCCCKDLNPKIALLAAFSQIREPQKATSRQTQAARSMGFPENAHWPFDDFFC